jgi:PPM family protein phosphatase
VSFLVYSSQGTMILTTARSHPGMTRSSNEDSVLTDPGLGLLVVADGMGGHRGGEVASAMAVRSLHEFVQASRTDSAITWPCGLEVHRSFEANQLKNAAQVAHWQVHAESLRNPDLQGMGSTLVALIVTDNRVTLVNVGDSRCYLFRQGALTQLSIDDSWAASLMESGLDPDTIRAHPMRNMLTQALGSDQVLDIHIREETLEPGDLLLLCSDGLYGVIGEGDMRVALSSLDGHMEAQADRLIELANLAGGPDNITVVIARYEDEGAPDTGPPQA